MSITKQCLNCRRSFIASQSSVKFCSRQCYGESKRGIAPSNKKSIERLCETCGAKFLASVSVVERGRAKYCSRKCFGIGHSQTMMGRGKNRISMICKNCQTSYEVIPSWVEGSRFCSKTCQNDYKTKVTGMNHPLYKERIRKICSFCKKEYFVKPSLANRSKFCSRQCQGGWTVRHGGKTSSLERIVEAFLIEQQITHIPQKQMAHFLCDFVLPDYHLVIECDGSYWHSSQNQKSRDAKKDSWLVSHGYTVLRLPESVIKTRPDIWQHEILSMCHLL